MDQFENTIEVIKALKQIRKMEDTKLTLMLLEDEEGARAKLIKYIVSQMEEIEDEAPEMVKSFDGGFSDIKW